MTQNTQPTIKFNLYNVTDGTNKARVHYHVGVQTDGRRAVTIYARDYGSPLGEIFGGAGYRNDTDTQTDYFDQGNVTVTEDSPAYADTLAQVTAVLDKLEIKDNMRRYKLTETAARAALVEKRAKEAADELVTIERMKTQTARRAEESQRRIDKATQIKAGAGFVAPVIDLGEYSLTVGSGIYYNGDMANIPGAGIVVDVNRAKGSYGYDIIVVLDDGRHMMLRPSQFKASPGRRFMTLAERADQLGVAL